MPDFPSPTTDPRDSWQEAFAALPLEEAPADGWGAVARRLDARRRRVRRWLPLAAAAALALAVVPTWLPQPTRQQPAAGNAQGTSARQQAATRSETLEQVHAESARLEALLQYARDGRMASGAAAVMTADFDARITAIDAALVRPGLSSEQRMQLWRERVGMLRDFASFESTRRLLAASGERYDGALVHVD